ncbi:hypothetical protein HY631_04445 [Candidatus Uhrbacteria bacterium]|nr:hypothetical protein [Candidatus Uhrbacteria bacterium]
MERASAPLPAPTAPAFALLASWRPRPARGALAEPLLAVFTDMLVALAKTSEPARV